MYRVVYNINRDMKVSQNKRCLFWGGVPTIRIIITRGLYWGHPIFSGGYHMSMPCPGQEVGSASSPAKRRKVL